MQIAAAPGLRPPAIRALLHEAYDRISAKVIAVEVAEVLNQPPPGRKPT